MAQDRADALSAAGGEIRALNRDNVNFGAELDETLRRIGNASDPDATAYAMIRASLARAKGDLSAVGAIEASALRKTLDKAGYGGLFAEASRSLAQETAQDYAAERAKLAQLSPAERLSYALERALDSGLGPQVAVAGALVPGKAQLAEGRLSQIQREGKLIQDGGKVENRLLDPIKEVERATGADIKALRAKYDLPEGHTLAAGRTDIPGLESKVFEGLSPELRKRAGLAPLDEAAPNRAVNAPFENPLFRQHAEEDLLNSLQSEITRLGVKDTDLQGKTISIHISNPAGVCNKCSVGLLRESPRDGVLKQFSQLHPTLTLRITAEGGEAAKGHEVLLIRNGALVAK